MVQTNLTAYLTALLSEVQHPSSNAQFQVLRSILGKVWQQELPRSFQCARLSLDKAVVLPNEQDQPIDSYFSAALSAELTQIEAFYQGKQDSAAYRYTLFHFVQAWGSRVASTSTKSEISIYDRNRIQAARQLCADLAPDAGLLLFKGGIGGIQQYIYHEIKAEQLGDADATSKRLRGRSFLVSYLSQVFAEYLVEQLGLEQANILFVGGGHFNLLLPNTPEIQRKLEVFTRAINLGTRQFLGAQLNIDMVWQPIAETQLNDVSGHFERLSKQLETSKKVRHQDYLADLFFPENAPNSLDTAPTGEVVPKADYIVELQSNDAAFLQLESIQHFQIIEALGFLDRYYCLLPQAKLVPFLTILAPLTTISQIKVLAINSTEFPFLHQSLPPTAIPIGFGFQFIGKYAPMIDKTESERKRQGPEAPLDRLRMFNELAGIDEAEQRISYPQLAAMRLDVDDLGTLFARGLGTQTDLTTTLALSREIQLFFGGYFNKLAEQYKLYITYSGGDDAFVIGSWLNTLHFAEAFNQAFRVFTCQNPHLGFSAGIFMCNPNYPVARFAKDAELLEDKAKKYRANKQDRLGKNAVCVFNRVYTWGRFEEMMNFSRLLNQTVPADSDKSGRKPIRRSMLQRLLDIIQLSQLAVEKSLDPKEKEKLDLAKDYLFFQNLARLHGLLARHGLVPKEGANDLPSKIVQTIMNESRDREKFLDYKLPVHYILYKTSEIKTENHA